MEDNMKYDYSIVIGRFQPFHNGHFEILQQASQCSNHVVILLGSSNDSINTKNPFSSEQRKRMISESIDFPNTILEINDYIYDDRLWIANVQKQVSSIVSKNSKIILVGNKSDDSSYYLNLFPQWDYKEAVTTTSVHATSLRKYLFEDCDLSKIKSNVPNAVFKFLEEFSKTEQYNNIVDEFSYIKKYKESWSNTPFPTVFVTVDNVVFNQGHVLLVKRKVNPGKGLFALPGGFISQNETLLKCAKRKLLEETGLNLDKNKRFKLIESKVFDKPDRSARGRTITHVYYHDYDSLEKFSFSPKESAFWMGLHEIKENAQNFFEDHYHILSHFVR